MIDFGVRVNTSGLLSFPDHWRTRAGQVVRKTAFAIERDAKRIASAKLIRDTGAGIASIYTVTDKSSAFGTAYARAEKLWRKKHPKSATFPMAEAIKPSGNPLVAYVVVGAHYMVYHEYGTIYMRRRMFLRPAARIHRSKYIKAMHEAMIDAAADAGGVSI